MRFTLQRNRWIDNVKLSLVYTGVEVEFDKKIFDFLTFVVKLDASVDWTLVVKLKAKTL